ncbi:DNA (cytosine-5-)-methyltransferase [[Clostridium] leptum DSM 753]|uniref:Cytosine-specific methyltransferase n=1 Tax=[Clostridium] leptum DSM 753 TaxID=428125 RepID=A7VQE1_9FIRM|nr:DNA (cytosine-5-)-methyltransferase [[Clostridium] leptum DSM 753]MCC3319698.1 DNA (cytosine-5-)-methyltransferase [[Clostridium] innocuum]PEQ23716.1 DNA (cytosine-5-)-methyltransferase [[Clostridium] leptum DSM 753]
MRQKTIRYLDLFSGIGGFREGLTQAGGFTCAGHCEIDQHADRSYRALFDTEGEWFCDDIRKADPEELPDVELLCGGFPCQAFSIAGNRGGFDDPRGTLFFEIARLTAAKRPAYLLLENVPGLLNHDGGRTFAAILHALDGLGYFVEWQVLNSKDFGVPQSRKRVYLIGYLDKRCRGKIFPFTETAGTPLIQIRPGAQGERVYSPEGVSCTLTAQPGGFGGKTGLYEVGLPIKENTKKGYAMAYPGDSIDLAYSTTNTRRGRVGRKIAHTLTADGNQGVLCFVDMNEDPEFTGNARCLTAKQNGGIRSHKGEASGVWDGKRIRRLTPRECLRLQGWKDERIDKVIPLQSDAQLYKQAGNGVTVNVVEAIGRRLAEAHFQG